MGDTTLIPRSRDPRTVLVALGFLSYCLYTDADSAAGNLMASVMTTALPVPYDIFSLGMVAVLGAGASLPRACTLLFDEKALVAGVALMTIGPLYAMLVGAGYAVYVLALCGGLGKAVVLLHLGCCLFLLGARLTFFVVAAMGALSALAGPLLSLHHASFSLASLVAAPVCGWCLYRVGMRKVPGRPVPSDAVVGASESAGRDFPRYMVAVVALASCTIFLLDPMTGGAGTPTVLHVSLLTLAAAAVSLAVLFATARNLGDRLWRAFEVMVCSFIVAACGFFAFEDAEGLWVFVTSVGCVLFQALFFVTAPFAAWGETQREEALVVAADRRFAAAALGYCAALSLAVFLYRVLLGILGAPCLVFIGVLVLLVGLLAGISVGFGRDPQISAPMRSSGRRAWRPSPARAVCRFARPRCSRWRHAATTRGPFRLAWLFLRARCRLICRAFTRSSICTRGKISFKSSRSPSTDPPREPPLRGSLWLMGKLGFP